jgi:CheY-like chemotaxis protein
MAGILILDTDGAQRQVIRGLLESRLQNMNVIEVGSDEDAVERTREDHPALVIIRPLSTEKETKEVIEVMREIDPGIPVVLISDKDTPSLIGLQKLFPLHPAEIHKRLLNSVRDALGQERSFIVKRRRLRGGSEGPSAFYIDLLTHDITNINQGVMGYLELLSILPETSEQQRKYISDSIGLLRMSTILLDNVRKDFSTLERTKPILLGTLLKEISSNIKEINPLRRIEVDLKDVPPGIKVLGSELLPDMFLQLMDFMIQRSVGPSQRFKFAAEPSNTDRISIRVHCNGESLPEDISRMLFQKTGDGIAAMGKLNICKRIADRVGGNVEYRLDPSPSGFSGGYYVVELKVVP